jgi:Family of unknown function (DUF5319)
MAVRLAVRGGSDIPSTRDVQRGPAVNLDDGPVDPFLDDPSDPAALLDDNEPAQPLSDDERADVLADLAELAEFRAALAPHGIEGITIECGDCGEQHFFGWDLMAANLRALLGEGRTHVHEPAFAPNPDAYVSWDYARGYADAVSALTKRH